MESETQRVFALRVPQYLTGGKEVFFTTLMVHRKHLPKRKLSALFYPIIVAENSKPDAIILPKWYWKY